MHLFVIVDCYRYLYWTYENYKFIWRHLLFTFLDTDFYLFSLKLIIFDKFIKLLYCDEKKYNKKLDPLTLMII